MSDIKDNESKTTLVSYSKDIRSQYLEPSKTPRYEVLERQLAEANVLVKDSVFKNYLTKLSNL
jgi:hypothetical protein